MEDTMLNMLAVYVDLCVGGGGVVHHPLGWSTKASKLLEMLVLEIVGLELTRVGA